MQREVQREGEGEGEEEEEEWDKLQGDVKQKRWYESSNMDGCKAVGPGVLVNISIHAIPVTSLATLHGGFS